MKKQSSFIFSYTRVTIAQITFYHNLSNYYCRSEKDYFNLTNRLLFTPNELVRFEIWYDLPFFLRLGETKFNRNTSLIIHFILYAKPFNPRLKNFFCINKWLCKTNSMNIEWISSFNKFYLNYCCKLACSANLLFVILIYYLKVFMLIYNDYKPK